MAHWFHHHTRVSLFGGEFSLRNVLLISVCIEVACVLTGFLVYEWQQRVQLYQLEVERSIMYEQVNDLMVEIIKLRRQMQELGGPNVRAAIIAE